MALLWLKLCMSSSELQRKDLYGDSILGFRGTGLALMPNEVYL